MIGIFDSGIGGLTVASAIIGEFPDCDVLYFGDTARTPYGTKSPETIVRYSLENTRFLIERGASMIVIACNTASSFATERLRADFSIPIFEVVSPAVKMAVSHPKTRSIGVIGTRGTIGSGIYERKIKEARPGLSVFSEPCPLLVPLVEEGWLSKPETRMIVKDYLHPLKTRQVDTLILGCTHYPVIKDIIHEKIGKRVRIIDSSTAVVAAMKDYIAAHPEVRKELGDSGKLAAYVSDITPQFEKIAKMILHRSVPLSHAVSS